MGCHMRPQRKNDQRTVGGRMPASWTSVSTAMLDLTPVLIFLPKFQAGAFDVPRQKTKGNRPVREEGQEQTCNLPKTQLRCTKHGKHKRQIR